MAGIVLNNPATQATFTNSGVITNTNADAVLGAALFPWTVNNKGTIANTGTAGSGVHLLQGGAVNNLVPGAVTAYASQIIGYDNGVAIEGASGLVTNLGFIEGTGTAGDAVRLFDGGKVVNGSATVTNALLDGQFQALQIKGGAGTVVNFGEIVNHGTHATIVLFEGGTVTNGASNSTAAYITGPGTGIYFKYGGGVITNFGDISGSTGVFLRAGGTVNNGASGSTTATITGTSGNAVLIAGSAGIIANFGTIGAGGTAAGVSLIDGGKVTNGNATVTGALIVANGTGIYAAHAPATVTNFGRVVSNSTTSGDAVALEGGGSVSNFGTLQNADASTVAVYVRGGGSVTNGKNGAVAGLITGAGSGLSFRGGVATVVNSGIVQGVGGNGIYVGGGGAITNQAGGLIEGGGDGILNQGFAITVTNSGTVKSTGTLNGIYLKSGGSVTNNAGAAITGGFSGIYVGRQGGVIVNHGLISGTFGVFNPRSGNLTLTNSGTIASTGGTAGAAIVLGNSVGQDKLVVEPGSVIIGTVNGGGNGEVDFVPGGVANVTNMFGFATIGLGNGVAHSVTLTDANFAGVNFNHITVVGGDSGNTVNAFGVTVKTHPVIMVGGAGTDVFTGGAGNDIFEFSAAALQATDIVHGEGNSGDTLQMTTAGTVNAAGVNGVEIYRLADGGPNTLSLTNNNFVGISGGLIRVYGGNGGNTVDGSAVSGVADQLVMYGGAGTDAFTGGAGNDVFVFTAANLGAADTVAGGTGNDELLLTTSGALNLGGVSGVENIALAGAGANTLTLTNNNFTGVTSTSIRVIGGNFGNTVNDSAVTGANALVFVGGAGNDVVKAGAVATITGHAGTNAFEFVAPGTHTITDFGASATNELVFSVSGFGLTGFISPSSTPQHWTAGNISASFAANTTGVYASSSPGFNYNTNNGVLEFSSTGSSSSQSLVATLTNHPGINAATQLFFVS